jgi:hypothetical protein
MSEGTESSTEIVGEVSEPQTLTLRLADLVDRDTRRGNGVSQEVLQIVKEHRMGNDVACEI